MKRSILLFAVVPLLFVSCSKGTPVNCKWEFKRDMTDFSSTDERGDINICSDSVTFGKGKNKEITCTRLQQDDYILFTVPVGKTAGKTDIDFSVTLTQDPGAEPSEWMAEYWEDGR